MSNRTSEEELRVCWRAEYARPLVGWDYTANVLAAVERLVHAGHGHRRRGEGGGPAALRCSCVGDGQTIQR